MKVLVDATPVRPQPSGVGFYVKNLVVALQKLTLSEQFGLAMFYQPSLRLWLTSRNSAHELDSLGLDNQRLDIPVRLSSPLLKGCYYSQALRAGVADRFDRRFGPPDIVHGSNYAVFPSHRARTVINIHDLTFMRYPQFVDAMVKTYESRLRCCLEWTDLVITVSESSKADIVHYLGVAPEKIWVTPLASRYRLNRMSPVASLNSPGGAISQAWPEASERTAQRNADEEKTQQNPALNCPDRSLPEQHSSEHSFSEQAFLGPTFPDPIFPGRTFSDQAFPGRAFPDNDLYIHASGSYDLRRPFLLFVSTIEPRKNIVNLVRAFNLLKSSYGIDHDLVLIGKKGWSYRPIFEEIRRSPWRSQIFHLDYLSNAWVRRFYQRADVFLYPSHYEGFGLPLLEAMTLGTPVVTSHTSSLPEVGGDAALYVSPQDPEEIAHQTLRLLSDSQLRQGLIAKGHQQAQKFSWEATARETLKAYRSLNP